MKILVSGSSGFIGQALIKRLIHAGHQVSCLVRTDQTGGTSNISWDPYAGRIDSSKLEGFDAVIHLAGRSIGAGRWSISAKKEIFNSRIIPTKFLAKTISDLKSRPKLFLSASAIGYYGDRKDEALSEESGPGVGFLSELCVAWEQACEPAREVGVRTVNLRIGLVLSADGGALPRMMTPFRFGLGGKLGNGRQYMSWITLDDLISILEFALSNDSLRGPVNAVTPNPVTNAEFTKKLAQAMHRPAIFPAPALALKLLLGEMGESLLLSGAKVIPAKLQEAGFKYQDSELQPALAQLLPRSS